MTDRGSPCYAALPAAVCWPAPPSCSRPLWPALWPPLAVVGVFLCLALLNLPPLLPALAACRRCWPSPSLLIVGLLVRGLGASACPTTAPPIAGWKPAPASSTGRYPC